MLKSAVPPAFLKALTSVEYANIPEFGVRNGNVFFILQTAETSKLAIRVARDSVTTDLSQNRFWAKSKLNCYGSSLLDVYADGKKAVVLSGDKLLFIDNDQVEEVGLPNVEKFVYGEPTIAGEFIYFIRAEDAKQSVVKMNIEDRSVVEVLDSVELAEGYFFGNMSFTPNKAFISYNKWSNGMPFDSASIVVRDLVEKKNVAEIKVSGGAAKYPRWKNDTELYFISDSTGYDRICCYNMVEKQWKETDIFTGNEDLGEPNWIVGQQWPMAVNNKFLVFADSQVCYCHTFETKETRLLNVDNITLMHFDDQNPDMVYFKSAGPVVTSLSVLDLSQKTLEARAVYNINLLPAESGCVGATPKLAKFGGINGYLTVPPNTTNPIPMIIWLHGGPTMRMSNAMDLRKQCLVAAGFGIFEPAFSGTAGFGRELRDKLYGKWGIQDATDVIDAANGLLNDKVALKGHIFLIGSSAGAYLALCSIARAPQNTFNAASVSASFYDSRKLVEESIPFEKDYTAHLLPDEKQDIEQAIVEKRTPIIFFHGLEDPVVPAKGPICLVDKLGNAGVRTMIKLFEGEGHSIKQAKNVVEWVESTFGFFTAK